MAINKKNIAGLSLGGGRKDNFFFCLLEYYNDSERWFLKSILQVKDEEGKDGNDALRLWALDFNLRDLVVDFPLTYPACHTCNIECPGINNCPEPTVTKVKNQIENLINEDKKLQDEDPKKYERDRNGDDEINFSFDLLSKKPDSHLLSRAIKRRLKKGYIPYWNRPIDVWVWMNYYDYLLKLFNISYDSFANSSLMLLSRFAYLKRHFPKDLHCFEASSHICLIELLRRNIISKKQIIELQDIELGAASRLSIVKSIEGKLGIFMYDHDVELLIKYPRAFQSFLLALVGQRILHKKFYELPEWVDGESHHFTVPVF